MRLHRLEMTAFGPFADTAVVDFDTLSDASVFLLCGDTGAGKTTVLDGVCFALYGDVPSARGAAKQLRSHHAGAGVAPRMSLEVSLGDRRLRFTRSPAWQRPKKRGSGTTTEQAHVLVEEHDGDAWVLRTNRLDEAGQLVGDVVGMTLAQFSQVVLLPQGQFDTFLRASSDDRQKVLTQLFQTGRFEQVERWFAEHRKELWRASRRHHGVVAGVVHRLSETAAVATPADWDPEDLTPAVTSGEVEAWAAGLLAGATTLCDEAATRLAEASAARAAAEAGLAEGRRLDELHRRRDAALAGLAELATTAAAAEDDRHRLAAALRAASVAPVAGVADSAARTLEKARGRSRAAVAAVAGGLDTAPDELALEELDEREQEARDRLASARAFLPRAAELREAQRARLAAEELCTVLTAGLDATRERLVALPTRRAGVMTGLQAAGERAARLPECRSRVERLQDQLDAARLATELEAGLADAVAAEEAQTVLALAARERWLQLREQRLDGMAAELAAALAVGQDCPVCGSPEHPAPARAANDAPTRADEQAALRESEDAQVALEAHHDRVRGLRTRLQAARERSGDRSADTLTEDVARARSELAEDETAAGTVGELEARVAALDAEQTAAQTSLSAGEARLEATRERVAELAATADRLTEELAALVGDEADGLEEVIAGHERTRDLLAAAVAAIREEARCAEHATEAAGRLDDAARAAGFADASEAATATLDEDARVQLETAVEQRERREQELAAVLTDRDVAAVADQPRPALAELVAARESADRAHTEAASAQRVAAGALDRLRERCRELDDALTAWAPLRADYARVRALAELVEGKGSDNTRQMRLSAYVLASRLGQVVAAANERLVRMTDARYLLEHTAARGAGDRRGGLGLVVADQWTDERRDPVTLSGGETFVVSLALALGLADVVTAESGGTRIDTLFVDEGFGSLDADTLEQVMDTLDQLREGGRVVGVVSHVTEMRHRIPTQLRVVKGRRGSRLEAAG
ncbi:MAG TPA: SMC family ATPase [Marmoricola sp.]|nr:SMC family ATPase [Marmoricola sp.]